MKIFKIIVVAVIVMSALSLQAKMPKNTYACHVITDEQEIGIAFMQADKLSIAESEAINRSAYVAENRTQTTAQVVECVVIPANKLSDPIAQQLLDNIPR